MAYKLEGDKQTITFSQDEQGGLCKLSLFDISKIHQDAGDALHL